jgi:hypothetical protein
MPEILLDTQIGIELGIGSEKEGRRKGRMTSRPLDYGGLI